MRLKEDELTPKQLVLLPGLDGTGLLFADFLKALPETLATTVVAYPTKQFLSHAELLQLVSEAAPKTEPFVVLAESFSTPLALKYAATNPPNLAGVVLCAGFVQRPIGSWSPVVKAVAKPWFFSLQPPRFVLKHFLTGENAPPALIQTLCEIIKNVHPQVLSGRVREALDCDARNDLVRTTVPIMYLHAGHDRLLSPACRREIRRIRPDMYIETIEAPHLLLQREPQKAADLVATFMSQLGA